MLQGWTAHIPAGLLLLLDEEGEAKAGVLRLLAGELAPTAGSLSLNGAAHGSPAYGQQVFWRDPLAPWLQELTPLAWCAQLASQQPHWSAQQWQRHVQGFGLLPHLEKAMFQLSTGSQRKVLLAAALASGAPLTLIDEPVAALDRSSIAYLCAALAREAARPPGLARRVLAVAHWDALADDIAWQERLRLA